MRLPSVRYGFMNTLAQNLYLESDYLKHNTTFIEIQVHDELKSKENVLNMYEVSPNFSGYVTIHGEGETAGKKKIQFCSDNREMRSNYVKENIVLYSSIIGEINSSVTRLVLHPDTLNRNISRHKQIEYLAESLAIISDKLDALDICIEPRGGDRQGKVLRAEIEDLEMLGENLNSIKAKVGLCIDVAQLFVVHGNNGTIRFIEELKSVRLPVKEFHISDVKQSEKIMNRVAMEIGKGVIDWQLILPVVLQHCNELLIETLGGIKVFKRSKSYLESLVKEHEVLL